MKGLNVLDANLIVHVHPSQSKNVPRAILRQLSSLLFKHTDAFEGVVLAYSVETPDKHAKILSGIQPYFGVRLQAKVLVFSPKPDMLLEGKVVKVAQESIHVIVLGFSSAIITDDDIRGEFRYKDKHGEGVYVSRSHKWHVISVGTVIRFVVKSLDEETLHITGSLIPAHTGSISWLDKYLAGVTTDSDAKKRTTTEEEAEIQEHSTVAGEASSLINNHEMKKSKKKRRIADDH